MKLERMDRAQARIVGWHWEACPEDGGKKLEHILAGYTNPDMALAALERGEVLSTGFADYRKAQEVRENP